MRWWLRCSCCPPAAVAALGLPPTSAGPGARGWRGRSSWWWHHIQDFLEKHWKTHKMEEMTKEENGFQKPLGYKEPRTTKQHSGLTNVMAGLAHNKRCDVNNICPCPGCHVRGVSTDQRSFSKATQTSQRPARPQATVAASQAATSMPGKDSRSCKDFCHKASSSQGLYPSNQASC